MWCSRLAVLRRVLLAVGSCLILVGLWAQPAAAADVSAPTIESLDFQPRTVDVTGKARTVKVTARITDTGSGLSRGSLTFLYAGVTV
ncbi:MAG: hypothetical protein F2817_13380, partial [Actinobacteria bacterium]|nr:hypothetical protein [Actinomycetota bacterium]